MPGFERVELRCPRNLDPRPSWTLGDVLAELDALDATRQNAPPTPLKQPPDWYLSSRSPAYLQCHPLRYGVSPLRNVLIALAIWLIQGH